MQTTSQTDTVTVTITANDGGTLRASSATRNSLHPGPLAGLKLIGFAIWERRGAAAGTLRFPARQYHT